MQVFRHVPGVWVFPDKKHNVLLLNYIANWLKNHPWKCDTQRSADVWMCLHASVSAGSAAIKVYASTGITAVSCLNDTCVLWL